MLWLNVLFFWLGNGTLEPGSSSCRPQELRDNANSRDQYVEDEITGAYTRCYRQRRWFFRYRTRSVLILFLENWSIPDLFNLIFRLVSIEDSYGCKRSISVPGITANVR